MGKIQANIGSIINMKKVQANIGGSIKNLKKAQANIGGVIKTIWTSFQGFVYATNASGKLMKISPEGTILWTCTEIVGNIAYVRTDTDGYVYVTSVTHPYDNRDTTHITKVSSEGGIIWTNKTSGDGSNDYSHPNYGLSMDNSGNIYVVTGHGVEVFSSSGVYQRSFGGFMWGYVINKNNMAMYVEFSDYGEADKLKIENVSNRAELYYYQTTTFGISQVIITADANGDFYWSGASDGTYKIRQDGALVWKSDYKTMNVASTINATTYYGSKYGDYGLYMFNISNGSLRGYFIPQGLYEGASADIYSVGVDKEYVYVGITYQYDSTHVLKCKDNLGTIGGSSSYKDVIWDLPNIGALKMVACQIGDFPDAWN